MKAPFPWHTTPRGKHRKYQRGEAGAEHNQCPPHSRAGSGVSAFLVGCKHAGWAPNLASEQVNPAFEQDLHIPRTQNKPSPPWADREGAWFPNFKVSEGENSLFQANHQQGVQHSFIFFPFLLLFARQMIPITTLSNKAEFSRAQLSTRFSGTQWEKEHHSQTAKKLLWGPKEVTAEGSRCFRELLSFSLGLFSTVLKANISQEWKHGFQVSRCKEK